MRAVNNDGRVTGNRSLIGGIRAREDCGAGIAVLRTEVKISMHKVRLLRRPVGSHRSLNRRKKIIMLLAALALGTAGVLALLLAGCGGGNSSAVVPPPPVLAVLPLQIADVPGVVAV